MVVLELEGHTNMLGSGPNQYLQPDYLSPLSSPLDSKVSPLALLAQTCSQIGSDGPSAKSIFDTSKRKLSTCSESSLKSESSCSSDAGGGGSNSKDPPHNNNNSSKDKFDKDSSSSSNNNNNNNNNRPKSSSGGSSVSPPQNKSASGKSSGSPSHSPSTVSHSPAFKPYEMIKSSSSGSKSESSSVSEKSNKKHHHHNSSSSRSSANSSPKVKTPNSRSTSTPPDNHKEISVVDKPTKVSSGTGSASETKSSSLSSGSAAVATSSASSDRGASPIIRSGLEVLQQGQFGSSMAAAEYNRKLNALSSLGYPANFDAMHHPAFRPPFHHALSAGGYPIPGGSPYVSYSRVKTASGAETIVPVCKDPYCSGCQFGGGGVPHGTPHHGSSSAVTSMNGLMAAAAAAAAAAGYPGLSSSSASSVGLVCPAGCVQCDHPKFPISSLPQLFPPSLTSSLTYPTSLLSQQAAQQQNAQRPYVCNWIVGGEGYCGKRYSSSEELLQHLRTHTNSSSNGGSGGNSSSSSAADSAALAAMVQQQHQLALVSSAAVASPSGSIYSNAATAALLNQSAMAAAAAAMHRTYPTPPLSPLSAARYHPYATGPGKVSGLVPPPNSAGNAAAVAALSSYYHPYALYGQRLGPSVHP